MKKTELRQIVAETLEISPVDLESTKDLTTIRTFDSVAILTLMISLDERAGVKLSPAEAKNLHFYGDIEKLAEGQGILLTD